MTRMSDAACRYPQRSTGFSLRFFYWFSRFEFALKECGYLKSHEFGAPAQPDWQEFTKKHQNNYRLTAAAKELIAANPLRQIVGRAGIEFAQVGMDDRPNDLERVTRLARTVRNNLFHGGQHGEKTWDDPDRIRTLLPLVIRVLNELAEHAGIESDYRRWY